VKIVSHSLPDEYLWLLFDIGETKYITGIKFSADTGIAYCNGI